MYFWRVSFISDNAAAAGESIGKLGVEIRLRHGVYRASDRQRGLAGLVVPSAARVNSCARMPRYNN